VHLVQQQVSNNNHSQNQKLRFMDQFNNPAEQRPLPNGTAVLVLGILSIVVCFITGIIALVMAKKDMALYNANPGMYSPASLSNIKTGKICAIIGIVLQGIGILVYIVILVVAIGAVGATGGFK
jgi:M penetrans paralogue family 26